MPDPVAVDDGERISRRDDDLPLRIPLARNKL